MPDSPTFLLLAGAVAAAAGVALVFRSRQAEAVDPGAVLSELEGDGVLLDEFSERLRQPVLGRIVRPLGRSVAGRIGALLPHRRMESLRHKLLVAGALASVGPEEFVVLQAAGGGGGLLLGLLVAQASGEAGLAMWRLAAMLGAIGAFAPVAWLHRRTDERKNSIRKDLPDVLDLMAISVEAGVGFEGAMAVVTEHFHTPLSEEFRHTLREMELGLPRRDALQNLKRRTEVPELSNFILILVQADSLGMPIGRVLRSQAVEMRMRRRQWAREKAGKLPVKIMLPLVLFILPGLFVVIIGPGAISIMKTL